MAIMNEAEEQERKIVHEFCHLLEKSKQLFNGLRDLPQYGHKQWQAYFGRTFDVYTKLWKFQQQHRGQYDLACFLPNFDGEQPGGGQEPPTSVPLPPTSLRTCGLTAI
ncbi:protein SCAI [Trichonephila clavipes]|nr:protein SCAI [Trichonephila clavipes]